jgi:hypothetical protein
MSKRINDWLSQHGFEFDAWRWDFNNLRVGAIGDEFLIMMFTGRAGETAMVWSARFPCPDGKLSAPEDVVLATIKQAFKHADVSKVRS